MSSGILAGVVIVILAVTGSLLTVEHRINAWADGLRVEAPSVGGAGSGRW